VTYPLNQMTSDLITGKDTNGDKALSVDELGVSQDVFSTIDTNNDGVANAGELNAAFLSKNPIWNYLKTANAANSTTSNSSGSTTSVVA
jgi:hypothetical protein